MRAALLKRLEDRRVQFVQDVLNALRGGHRDFEFAYYAGRLKEIEDQAADIALAAQEPES